MCKINLFLQKYQLLKLQFFRVFGAQVFLATFDCAQNGGSKILVDGKTSLTQVLLLEMKFFLHFVFS